MPRDSIFLFHQEAVLRQRRGERSIDGVVLPTMAAALTELPRLAWAPNAPVAGEIGHGRGSTPPQVPSKSVPRGARL